MENAFDYEVSYEWTITPNCQFNIEPAKGSIKPHSSMTTTFVYGFENGGEPGVKIEESAKLKIKYGRNVEVKCSALIPESHCVCKSQEIQFKEVAIGRTVECKMLIKNMSKIDTIYKVNIPREIENILSITTRTGSILSEEMTELCFKLTSPKTLLLDSMVQISIKGSKNFELPVKANVILPKVYVENEEIDFGRVPVEGNPGEKQITLVNDSNISVDL